MLYGSITLRPDNSYDIYHKNLADGWDVTLNIPIQKGPNGLPKNYSVIYFVYEKVAPCQDYPPDGEVLFTNITIQFDGHNVTDKVQWKTSYVEDVCNNRATVIDPQTIKITWDTSARDPAPELIEASQSGKLGGLRKPVAQVAQAAESEAEGAKPKAAAVQ